MFMDTHAYCSVNQQESVPWTKSEAFALLKLTWIDAGVWE